ncbi:HlyD family efflux transporter periplasmic adaptor subunit [Thalassomonas viridans]|uniref:HlyD family efflux transporter periplasmic adaptor subunit n=1 Tax=Thalassomonas viridans TaxID=137584 RepID=A0AAE9YZI0_9GAMM|nr:HlyD family efflux transporter periplasmic adaptor subunit [Thalassomonas viridans]WDE04026.1 HlyD family efflux transporter periplasmic adaptor subunit [Thalassomonas viridans]
MIADTQSQDEVIENTKKTWPLKSLLLSALAIIFVYLAMPTLSQWYAAIPDVDGADLVIAPVIRGELVRETSVSGKAVAANAPGLFSTEAGKITLLAKPGEAVEEGQLVARLSSPELEAEIKQQQSTLEQLNISASRGLLEDKEAQLELESQMNAALSSLNVARREKQRAEISFGKQIISEVDWMKSQDTLTDAERFYQHAKKRVELARERLTFETRHREFLVQKQQLILDELLRRQQALAITAPVTGVVGNWLVAQKNTVAANTEIMTIVDLSEYEAELSVPEFYADDLGLGLTVMMTVAGVDISGEIIAISPEVKNNQVKVRASINDTKAVALRQNQRISARIEFEKKADVLMVKRGAFIGALGGRFAYKLGEDNQARKIAISTGISSLDYIELTSGVAAGEQLIISDYQEFSTSEQINISY